MSLMGFSFNLLTILAIVLSVGLVVDDAIVMVENVARAHARGARPERRRRWPAPGNWHRPSWP